MKKNQTMWIVISVAVMVLSSMMGCDANKTLEQDNRSDQTTSQQNNTDQDNKDNDAIKDVTGKWIFKGNDSVKPEHYNVLTLKEDKTFELVVNLYEGMGNINGTYSLNGNNIECKVGSRDFYGFLGDKVEQFNFLIAEGTLSYQGEPIGMIGMAASPTVFEKER